MDTISKVCKKEIIPKPKLVEYPAGCTSSDDIVSAIMKRAEEICKKVCTVESISHSR